MEKWAFTLLIFLITTIQSTSQVSLHALAGSNFSWVSQDKNHSENSPLVPDDELKYQPYRAQAFGVQIMHSANERVNVGFELQYSQNGSREADDRVEINYHYIRYVQTLEVETYRSIRLGAGLYWGYLVSRNEKGRSGYSRYLREEWDYGSLLYASTKFKRFYFRLSFMFGFSTLERLILKGFSGSNPQFLYYRNKSAQIMLGYDLIEPKRVETPDTEVY